MSGHVFIDFAVIKFEHCDSSAEWRRHTTPKPHFNNALDQQMSKATIMAESGERTMLDLRNLLTEEPRASRSKSECHSPVLFPYQSQNPKARWLFEDLHHAVMQVLGILCEA